MTTVIAMTTEDVLIWANAATSSHPALSMLVADAVDYGIMLDLVEETMYTRWSTAQAEYDNMLDEGRWDIVYSVSEADDYID